MKSYRRSRRLARGPLLLTVIGLVGALTVPIHASEASSFGTPSSLDSALLQTSNRRLFELSDGSLIHFASRPALQGAEIVYTRSSDDGTSWTVPELIVTGRAGATFDVERTVGTNFRIAYLTGSAASGALNVMTFAPTTDSMSAASASTGAVDVLGASTATAPQLLYLGEGPAGSRFLLAFDPVTALGQRELHTTLTETGGSAWTPPVRCAGSPGRGILAVAGSDITCVAVNSDNTMSWSSWTGLVWSPGGAVPIRTRSQLTPSVVSIGPSLFATSSDTAGVVKVAQFAGGSWRVAATLGAGERPIIGSLGGVQLTILAERTHSTAERVIAKWQSTDGNTWSEAHPIGGHELAWVLDENTDWSLEASASDAVFAISESNAWQGNVVGLGTSPIRLDGKNKRAAVAVGVDALATVSAVALWTTGNSSPEYRVGLQGADAQGNPTGLWLNQVSVGTTIVSGAFGSMKPPGPTSQKLTVDITDADLQPGVAYFIVVEWNAGVGGLNPEPTATQWAQLDFVQGDTTVHTDDAVLSSNSSPWSPIPGAIGRYTLVDAAGATVRGQQIGPAAAVRVQPDLTPVQEFTNDGETALTVDTVRFFLHRVGTPQTSPALKVLSSSNQEIATYDLPAGEGWSTAATSGLTFQAGQTYRLALVETVADESNGWLVATSGDATKSWNDSANTLYHGTERPGMNDRTTLATDAGTRPIRTVDTSSTDALYVGDTVKFSSVAFARSPADAGDDPLFSPQYWNGTTWRNLTAEANTLGAPDGGRMAFAPPADWEPVALPPGLGYFIKLTPTVFKPVLLDRVTANGSTDRPVFAAHSTEIAPVVFRENSSAARAMAREVRPFDFLSRGPFSMLWPRAKASGGDRVDAEVGPPISGRLDIDAQFYDGYLSADPADGHAMSWGEPVRTLAIKPLSTSPPSHTSVVNDSLVMYRSTYPGADLMTRVLDDGIEDLVLIRDSSAPTSYSWKITEPAVVTYDSLTGEIRDTATAQVVAVLNDVWAVDAKFASVATSVSLSGNTLTVDIAHQSPTTTYPIILDPDPRTHPRRDARFLMSNDVPVPEDLKLRIQGYLAYSSVEFGYPCYVGDKARTPHGPGEPTGTYRPECHAQALVVRRLSYLERGSEYQRGADPEVHWETGAKDADAPEGEDKEPIDQQQEANLTEARQKAKAWRADITNFTVDSNNQPRYGVLEVKRFAASTDTFWGSVEAQLARYHHNFGLRDILTSNSGKLHNRAFVGRYARNCAGSQLGIVWAPQAGDISGKTKTQFYGHIYFGELGPDPIPQRVKDRAYLDLDADYQQVCQLHTRDAIDVILDLLF